ncbi:MAG: DinB family protein [Armatimonadetes bacterium]|nr:DinB family protein [Armatimonadota bacterium]
MPECKAGRGRRYCVPASDGLVCAELAALCGALDELSARHRDLIEDLPGTALCCLPPGLGNHLASLTRHMAWAECRWITMLACRPMAPELEQALTSDAADGDAAALLCLCERVRREVTRPALAGLPDAGQVVTAEDGRLFTPRGVLQHLLWHWTYHGGQCGLLRRLSGHPYRWSFDEHAFGG